MDLTERIVATRVGPEAAGQRLDAWLAARFTYHSRQAWQRLVATGRITVAGNIVRPAHRLRQDEEVRFAVNNLAEPPVADGCTVIHEDPTFVVVDKPAPLPCHPAGPFFRHTLWYRLHHRYGHIHLVNRLDRETSGLILVARNPQTAARLARSPIRKNYLVVVHGITPEQLDAKGLLLPDPTCAIRKRRRFLSSVEPDGETDDAEAAHTRFRRLAHDGELSLLAAELITGRTHQIRATLCSLGHPVVGDKLYGPDPTIFLRFLHNELSPDDHARLILTRQALHAHTIAFRHPQTEQPMAWSSPLPSPLAEFCARRFGPTEALATLTATPGDRQ